MNESTDCPALLIIEGEHYADWHTTAKEANRE